MSDFVSSESQNFGPDVVAGPSPKYFIKCVTSLTLQIQDFDEIQQLSFLKRENFKEFVSNS